MTEEKTKSFINLIRRSQRGRLKIYLGYCAGVGKTYRMLQEAHALKNEGIDVAVGFVETHGRRETIELLEGLEILPRTVKEYKGITVEEMDVDSIISRKPEVVLIDELAHNNLPGSRNLKRYQDVQEVIDSGIHVLTTLNVQHLESLYNTVEKFVGVKVRERLPDTIIAEADQIVNVDVSTEDLQKRLEEGKVYPKERIQTAMNNFFTFSNLEKLRELTLRELAAQIDERRKEPDLEDISAMPDQIMVCLSSRGPNSEQLLRYASRLAGRLNKNWYALYVQREYEEPSHIDLNTQNALAETLTLAKQLGAIVFTYKGEDLVETIIRFAREYRVGHVIIGTPSHIPFYKRIIGRKTLSERLIREAKGINIVIMDTTPTQAQNHKEKTAIETAINETVPPKTGIETKQEFIQLSDFLTPATILLRKEPLLKEEVIRDLVRSLYHSQSQGYDPHSSKDFSNQMYNLLMEREKESSTFFNEGVAFPHLRIVGEDTPKIALGVIPQGILNTSATKPVRLVFLIISSINRIEQQAKLLAKASKIAANNHLVEVLLSAGNSKKIYDEIKKWESNRCK